ncbi:MAG: DUF1836 domain-containing protein [Schaedlerella sp.]|nr:DUF1836 domain-containing protein [Schaedlerella sp.]
MKLDSNNLLDGIIEKLSNIDYVHSSEIPNIDLYMDQVTTFMDAHLSSTKRYEDDKILTKTMINNYTKNNLLPPSNKKKYSKEHVLLLILIYYFKSFLSIKDIETFLAPLKNNYFSAEGELDLTFIYEELFKVQKSQIGPMIEDMKQAFSRSEQTFADVPEKDRETLQTFALLCDLSFDVYIKKMLIERILDDVFTDSED